MIHPETLNILKDFENKFRNKAENYKIGKAVSRDIKIRTLYKQLADDLQIIIEKIESGLI